jgi:hypothetical protein
MLKLFNKLHLVTFNRISEPINRFFTGLQARLPAVHKINFFDDLDPPAHPH